MLPEASCDTFPDEEDISACFSGACHFEDPMGLTRATYIVSISSRLRPFDSIKKKKTTTTNDAQQAANTKPYK